MHQKMTLRGVHTLLSASCHRRTQRSRPLDRQRPNLLMSLDFSDLGFELPELSVFLLEITQTPESQPAIQIPHTDEGNSHSIGQALLQCGDESSVVGRAGRTTSV